MKTIIILGVPLMIMALGGPSQAQPAVYSDRDIFHPLHATQGMVASQEEMATKVGVRILKEGGNAVDAAVAVGFALAVTLPRAGNLGGGGFMLVHLSDKETVAIDFREMAPANAKRDMFLTDLGKVDREGPRFSYRAVGVPGTVAGLALALERYGTMPLKRVMAPAIKLASKGIPVSQDLALTLGIYKERLLRWPESRKIFFRGDEPYRRGELLVQRDLARTLREIRDKGARAFYEGSIAKKIADDMRANGGLITLDDLKAYRPVVREPLQGTYRGYDIFTMPPPSSGGVHLVQMLNVLERFPLREMGHNSAAAIHRMAEAMKMAYADRYAHLADPAFHRVPVKGLISKAYAEQLAKGIEAERSRPASWIKSGDPLPFESAETTHLSVADKGGNVVTMTTTLNFNYGAGMVAAGTGILLNDEMNDFAKKATVVDSYGATVERVNAIAPAKRPLSAMAPTIVMKDGKPFIITGSPGGGCIITTLLQVIVNVIDHGMNVAQATMAPRVHHQWRPDELRVEPGVSPDTRRLLEGMGYRLVTKEAMGAAQSIMVVREGFLGASDPRRLGGVAAGY